MDQAERPKDIILRKCEKEKGAPQGWGHMELHSFWHLSVAFLGCKGKIKKVVATTSEPNCYYALSSGRFFSSSRTHAEEEIKKIKRRRKRRPQTVGTARRVVEHLTRFSVFVVLFCIFFEGTNRLRKANCYVVPILSLVERDEYVMDGQSAIIKSEIKFLFDSSTPQFSTF